MGGGRRVARDLLLVQVIHVVQKYKNKNMRKLMFCSDREK